jgi:hypothetical protein
VLHFQWQVTNDEGESVNIGGTNLFKYEMILTDISSKEIILQESKYLCYEAGMSATQGQIGTTDENGEFAFNNKLAFPHLFDLGEQPHIGTAGDSLGTFVLSDSINIKLLNPVTDEYLIISKKMTAQNNQYELFWENPEELKFEQSREVNLTTFNAEFVNSQFTIFWSTQSEIDNSGWNIYRAESDQFAEASKVNNELIDGSGTTAEPTDYIFVDETDYEFDTTYWYWIESVDYNENSEVFGPLSINIPDSPEPPIPPIPPFGNSLNQNYPNPFN